MNIVRTVVLAVTLATASSFLLAGVYHPPNDNKICSRVGCLHYRQVHDRNSGRCMYYLEDGCDGFVQ